MTFIFEVSLEVNNRLMLSISIPDVLLLLLFLLNVWYTKYLLSKIIKYPPFNSLNSYLLLTKENEFMIRYRSPPITIPFGSAIEFIFAHIFIVEPNRSSPLELVEVATSTLP